MSFEIMSCFNYPYDLSFVCFFLLCSFTLILAFLSELRWPFGFVGGWHVGILESPHWACQAFFAGSDPTSHWVTFQSIIWCSFFSPWRKHRVWSRSTVDRTSPFTWPHPHFATYGALKLLSLSQEIPQVTVLLRRWVSLNDSSVGHMMQFSLGTCFPYLGWPDGQFCFTL